MSAHRSAHPGDRFNRGRRLVCRAVDVEGRHLRALYRKTSPSLAPPRHRRQLPHTAVSARLEPLALPYQHESSPENLTQKPTSPNHQHRRPPSAFDPTTAAQPSRREPLFLPLSGRSLMPPRFGARRWKADLQSRRVMAQTPSFCHGVDGDAAVKPAARPLALTAPNLPLGILELSTARTALSED
jgi:hypothetical protein